MIEQQPYAAVFLKKLVSQAEQARHFRLERLKVTGCKTAHFKQMMTSNVTSVFSMKQILIFH